MLADPWSPDGFSGAPFAAFRDLLDPFRHHSDWPSLEELERQWLCALDVRTPDGAPLQLLPQPAKLRRARPRNRSELYDVSVCNGLLPTRSHNWHDFFNVLMFAAFPASKRQLHARHRHILEQRLPAELVRLPGARTVEQDCLTMLDEGGVLFATDAKDAPAVELLLENGDHHQLATLACAGRVKAWLLGHAHAEHLAKVALTDSKAPLPRAKPVVLPVGVDAARREVDLALAARLCDSEFCAARDGWRAVALESCYCELLPVV